MAIKSNGKPKTAEPQGSSLYEVIKGIDFEKRELLGKPQGRGLFDLVRDKGELRCYACTLCARTCPTDCIEIDYCPEHPELPFDAAAASARRHERPAAGRELRFGLGLPRRRRAHGAHAAARDRHEALRRRRRQAARRLGPDRGPARHPGDLRLAAPPRPRRDRRRAQAAVLARLRRGQLLRPVPARAGRQVRHLASAWAPPATWPARRWWPKPSARSSTSPSAPPRPTCSSRCRRSTAWAPAPSPRPSASATRSTHGRMTPAGARKLVKTLRRREEA